MAGEEKISLCVEKESMKKRDWQDYRGVLGGLRHTKAFPSGETHTWEGPGERLCV